MEVNVGAAVGVSTGAAVGAGAQETARKRVKIAQKAVFGIMKKYPQQFCRGQVDFCEDGCRLVDSL